jgi:hypothetical protein
LIYKARGIDNAKHDVEFELKEDMVMVSLNSLTGIEDFSKIALEHWVEITKSMQEKINSMLKEKI